VDAAAGTGPRRGQLAERRYKAIDPDQRVVARTLEREWNDKRIEMERLAGEYQEVRRREKVDPDWNGPIRIPILGCHPPRPS
jgi:hypothetical protein